MGIGESVEYEDGIVIDTGKRRVLVALPTASVAISDNLASFGNQFTFLGMMGVSANNNVLLLAPRMAQCFFCNNVAKSFVQSGKPTGNQCCLYFSFFEKPAH